LRPPDPPTFSSFRFLCFSLFMVSLSFFVFHAPFSCFRALLSFS
jgi:hypothetical protein